ncbi:AAA family ATPase [Myxosarcina sp. GI1]|uniref:AAA family ATPase n=1 Tax=Myxosarcina sp. GI1 TaxID=1541065 RepID=UPI000561A028|nr:AAA family ATPase [Myxosarcina sp. GI1]
MAIALPDISVKTKIYESVNSLVYRAVRRADNTAVVLKVLKQNYPTSAELIRYKQEYEITRSLDLEGVIEAYNQQDYQRTLVIILEDFGGESLYKLREFKEISCPMPLAEFLRLAIAITEILGKIHAANVIHKDINPSNIVLNPRTGIIKIIDFGIATRLTRTNPTFKNLNILEGTFAYMSPEQTGRMNRSLDYRTDFYSLGVTFYELLTGKLPFATTDVLELVHCHIAKQPIPVHEVNLEIPPIVSAIVMKLMAKNAEERYQSAWGIKTDLEKCLKQLETKSCLETFPLGSHDISNKFQIPQKLYGRETEIETLLTAFERVATTNDRQSKIEMLLVAGYSGIGKSYLVHEIYKPITEKCGYFISGKFDQFKRNIPYSAVVDAFQELVEQLLSESETQLQRWREKLLTALGANGQVIIDVIPEVESIVGIQPAVPDLGATESQNRFNRVFQNFIRVFCSHEYPLVIFLDDLQWVDSATLKLIELMMSDRETQYLFLIGAYRDNEVYPTHPLMMTVERLKEEAVAIAQITLAPLRLEAIARLIAETLHSDTSTVKPLAELVMAKTGGNPFFINEFLKTLYAENLITFNSPDNSQFSLDEKPKWNWDITQIEAKNITDNVVEMTVAKLKKLSNSTQQILQLAACVGADFDLDTLAIVCKKLPHEIFPKLVEAIELGLILPVSRLDEALLIQNYKFLHDRIQQAAYALIAEDRQQAVRLQIGYLLWQSSEPGTIPDKLFEIVDCLNLGLNLVTERQERNKIAKLNLIAGQRAKKTSAYSAALQYLTTGIELLAADSWQFQYALTLALHEEATEAAYLYGDVRQMERWAAVVLERANTVLDKIKVYETKIQNCMVQGRQTEAIEIGLEVLELLGIALPEMPTEIDVRRRITETAEYFSAIHIEDLLELPLMQEPDKLAAMQILSSLVAAGHQVAPLLLPLTVLEQINLSARYGNTSFSTHAYAAYGGLILNGVMRDFAGAYRFGRLALSLTERLDDKKLKCMVLEIVAGHIMHCKDPIRQTLPLLQESYETGLETGNIEFSAYAANFSCLHSYFAGLELKKVISAIESYSDAIIQFKQENMLTYLRRLQQVILNLQAERVENPGRLLGDCYDENQFLPIHLEANDRTHLHHLYLDKLILNYLFEDVLQAVEYASQTELYLDGVVGNFSISLFYFYDSLAQIQLYQLVSFSERELLLPKIISNQEKMQEWANSAPTNYQHKYDLVEAEKARILGQFFEAEELYEQAIQGARNNEYLQEEALAYELAAKHYLARGREKIAQTYMREAHYCYDRWGAKAKVADIEAKYPHLLTQSHTVNRTTNTYMKNSVTTTSAGSSQEALDLAAAMKASQAISSEIILDKLLSSLMKILIENAGAQTGFLILEADGEWKIEAACEMDVGTGNDVCSVKVLQSTLIKNRLPTTIIDYVIRTKESVVLTDATREGKFTLDPYVKEHQPKSILCVPLLYQGQLNGIVYLENNLTTGAFKSDRLKSLQLLSGQAAIAITNAKLYAEVKERESRLTQFINAMPVAITVIDSNGRICYVNQMNYKLCGINAMPETITEELLEQIQVYQAGTDRLYAVERLPIFRALAGETVTVDDIEFRCLERTIPISVSSTPVFDEKGNIIYAISTFQDISDRKQTEKLLANYNRTLEQKVAERTAALQESKAALCDVYDELHLREKELRLITDALPACIFYTDINQYYRFVNQTCAVWFDCSREEIIGKRNREFLGEVAYQLLEPYIKSALEGQAVNYEAEVFYPSGKRYISATYIPDFDANDRVKGYYGLITDISEQHNTALRERKQAEETLVIEERNRMAREIHDTLAQTFTAIIIHSRSASNKLTADPVKAQIHLTQTQELARSGLAEARRSVEALRRPYLLENGQLSEALDRLVTQMQSSAETRIVCETFGTAYPLPAEVENNLLRIGQEALTNAIKYAAASEVRIQLIYELTQCILRVKDNGRGFTLDSSSTSKGFGLLGMTERASRIGAQLKIQSAREAGTEIVVSVTRR